MPEQQITFEQQIIGKIDNLSKQITELQKKDIDNDTKQNIENLQKQQSDLVKQLDFFKTEIKKKDDELNKIKEQQKIELDKQQNAEVKQYTQTQLVDTEGNLIFNKNYQEGFYYQNFLIIFLLIFLIYKIWR